ncbi:Tyrosine-protein kinase-like [Actinidia chinensis var. chinensis]|uniref:Tyrosine-protein kinase-like n=1 Tax=Actinidia chinensis var. chinensis TaxID=1590841 RepID=A0A2R6QSB3_ACTCC|nr:Tyrosine-protein kinase-like [Actinidia chinensis var. chinensis]
MRFLGFALLLIMAGSCLAANRKVLTIETRELAENENGKFENSGSSSVNNHHYIPREDFNNSNNNGGGTPKGGDGDTDGKV